MEDNSIKEDLICPHCQSEVIIDDSKAKCRQCSRSYPQTKNGQFDMRLQDEEVRNIEVQIGGSVTLEGADVKPLDGRQIDTKVSDIPKRISPELFSYVPKSDDDGEYILDLGCGSDTLESAVEKRGYGWVGIDIEGSESTILADAHSLPFKSNTFSGTISLKVLEHLQHPIHAVSEVARVTKPGGFFIGNVAFVEPFHENSYYHHSPVATLSTLETSGLIVQEVGPSGHGFLHIGERLYPFAPKSIPRRMLLPFVWLQQFWYFIGRNMVHHEKATDEFRKVRFAQEFEFVAEVPQ